MGFLHLYIFGFAFGAIALNSTDESNVSVTGLLGNRSNFSVDLLENASDVIAFPATMASLLDDAEELENASNLTVAQDALNLTSVYVAAKESVNGQPGPSSSTTSTILTTLTTSTTSSSSTVTGGDSSTISTSSMTTTAPRSTSEMVSSTFVHNISANDTAAATSSSSLNSSHDVSSGTGGLRRNSSKNASSVKNITFEVDRSAAFSKGHDANKATGNILKWTIVIVLVATLVIGTTIWLLSHCHRSPSSASRAEGTGDVESGLNPGSVLPVAEPVACENPNDKVSGTNEDTDSIEAAHNCCSSGVVLSIVQCKVNECSSPLDHGLPTVGVACDEGGVACDEGGCSGTSEFSNSSAVLEAVSPLHAEDNTPNHAVHTEDDTPNHAVPTERMGRTPISPAIDLKTPIRGSTISDPEETQGLMVFSLPVFSLARRWLPVSCRKPMTEGIQNLSNLSRTPSMSSLRSH